MISVPGSQAEGPAMCSFRIKFWIDARHFMHQLAIDVGAAMIVSDSDAYVVISGDTVEDCIQAAGGREILDSVTDGSR
jgi:hypothetical protein